MNCCLLFLDFLFLLLFFFFCATFFVLFFKKYLFLIDWWLLYNMCLIFVIHQHELTIGVHMSPSLWISFPSPVHSHPSRLLQSPSLSSLNHTANSHWVSIYLGQCICFHATLSIHLTISFFSPILVYKSVLCISIFIAALRTGSSIPSF